jgi:DNA-binding PadR family transcriptional regulator
MAVFRHGGLRLYLLKLLDDQPRHGYDVISLLEDKFFGLYAPSAGTVYPRLARLEAEGLIEHEETEGRKVYRLTDAGREELHRSEAELRDLEEELSHSVRALAREVRSEVHESVRDLREELKAAARDVRRETRAHGRAEGRLVDELRTELGERLSERLTDRGSSSKGGLGRDLAAMTRELLAASYGARSEALTAARDIMAKAREDALRALREDREQTG